MDFFKSLGQSPLKFNEIGTISKQLMALLRG